MSLELAAEICRQRGIAFAGERIAEGSAQLFHAGTEVVLKIFPEDELPPQTNEVQYLRLLHGRLPVETPELLDHGVLQGRPFILMSRLKGIPLVRLWTSLSTIEKEGMVTGMAEMLRALHSIPVDSVTFHETRWAQFIRGQLETLAERLSSSGLGTSTVGEMLDFINSAPPVENTSPPVICHTELMREHLFARRTGGRYRLSGLLDFEPSMVAVAEYDFCAMGLFVTAGEPGLFKRFQREYGHTGAPDGIMRMLLLHRYSNMKRFMAMASRAGHSPSIEELTGFWFGGL
jgi:hygromycin-B 7''-O-kinase